MDINVRKTENCPEINDFSLQTIPLITQVQRNKSWRSIIRESGLLNTFKRISLFEITKRSVSIGYNSSMKNAEIGVNQIKVNGKTCLLE